MGLLNLLFIVVIGQIVYHHCFNFSLFNLTGGTPYPGIEINEKFIIRLKDGYVMDKPEHTSDEMCVLNIEMILNYKI